MKLIAKKAMRVLRDLYDHTGAISIEKYDEFRRKTNDKSLLRFDTILNRFFEGRKERLFDAVIHYNHKIIRIEKMSERIDVYDLEIPGTHNFALASGIFVHNSAKQGATGTSGHPAFEGQDLECGKIE